MKERASKDLRVTDLLREVLGAGEAFGGHSGGAVRSVRIVDGLDAVALAHPHTALVITGSMASSGWQVEMALRSAWERAASVVVVPYSPVHAASVGGLADRLGIPLFLCHDDAFDVAVRVAAAIAQPEAIRAALLARVALDLAGLRDPKPRQIMSIVERALPHQNVYFTGADDGVLLGTVSREPGMVETKVRITDEHKVIIGGLVVQTPPEASDVSGRIDEVLDLAAATFALWASRARSQDERSGALSAVLLDKFVTGGSEAVTLDARALGWPVDGPFLLAVFGLAPSSPGDVDPTLAFRAYWPRRADFSPLIRYGDVWVGWYRLADDADDDNEMKAFCRIVETVVAKAGKSFPCSAGVSSRFESLQASASQAVLEATTAASIAVGVAGRVVPAGQMGPEQLLATLPREALAQPARMVLAGLLEADQDGTLLKTLACLLDVGLAPSTAALQLGVHRNTITARLQKIKELGYDPGDPQQRLALHLACTVLVPGT